jgi:hypothetical protein
MAERAVARNCIDCLEVCPLEVFFLKTTLLSKDNVLNNPFFYVYLTQ